MRARAMLVRVFICVVLYGVVDVGNIALIEWMSSGLRCYFEDFSSSERMRRASAKSRARRLTNGSFGAFGGLRILRSSALHSLHALRGVTLWRHVKPMRPIAQSSGFINRLTWR